jgi:hypothetical protein
MSLTKIHDTGTLKRRHWIAVCTELALEEAMDVLQAYMSEYLAYFQMQRTFHVLIVSINLTVKNTFNHARHDVLTTLLKRFHGI